MSVDTVTLKIPKPLYLRLQELIKDTGFRSPTEFVLFVLRDLAGAETQDLAAGPGRLRDDGPGVPNRRGGRGRPGPPGRPGRSPARSGFAGGARLRRRRPCRGGRAWTGRGSRRRRSGRARSARPGRRPG